MPICRNQVKRLENGEELKEAEKGKAEKDNASERKRGIEGVSVDIETRTIVARLLLDFMAIIIAPMRVLAIFPGTCLQRP